MKRKVIVRKTTWEDIEVQVDMPGNVTVRQLKAAAVEIASQPYVADYCTSLSTQTNFEALTVEN